MSDDGLISLDRRYKSRLILHRNSSNSLLLVPLHLTESLLQDRSTLFGTFELYLDQLKHLSAEEVVVQFVVSLDRSVKDRGQIWNNFVDDALSCSGGFLHLEVFLLKVIQLPLEVIILLLLHDLSLLGHRLILRKESLGLIMNEITQNLKRVLLFDLLPFKQLSYFSNPSSNIFHLTLLIFSLFLRKSQLIHVLFQILVAFLDLDLKFLYKFK
jgi:hypothetical protein